jgi:hypothetical protein
LEDLAIEGGVAENHNAFAYGLATVHECLRIAFSGLTLIPFARQPSSQHKDFSLIGEKKVRRVKALDFSG